MSVILLVRIFELILLINSPLPVIVFTFAFQNTHFLQSSKVTFDGALTHRQSLRHLFAGDCRKLFDEIYDFLLTLSEFRLRHISDIRCVGGDEDFTTHYGVVTMDEMINHCLQNGTFRIFRFVLSPIRQFLPANS